MAFSLAAYGLEWSGAPKLVSISMLVIAWCLIAIAVYRQNFFEDKPQKVRRVIHAAILLSVAAIFFAVWFPLRPNPSPPRRSWLALTDEQKREFISTLASQTEMRERIRIGCPLGNEEVCVSASAFIDLFKRGHFVVENDRVDRTTLAKPSDGVLLFKYGHADKFDPQDPNQGKWVHLSTSMQTIQKAFGAAGVKAKIVADESMPQDVIGVFFGIEPKS